MSDVQGPDGPRRRTPRGRVLTLKSYRHLGVSGPARSATPDLPIFEDDQDET